MVYNIYLNSPQLAYNANITKYNKYVIKKNNKIFNKKFSPYKPTYFYNGYLCIIKPNIIIRPY
jgi:hypothetical protein